MVSINFKYTSVGVVRLSIDNPTPLSDLLHLCIHETQVELGDIIAVKNGSVIQPDETVYDGDEILIFPALSGG